MRKYGKDDHESVCRLFYTTVMESWLPAYRRVVTFKAPIATIVQVVYLKMNHQPSIDQHLLLSGRCLGPVTLSRPVLHLVPVGRLLPPDVRHGHHLLRPLGLLLVKMPN